MIGYDIQNKRVIVVEDNTSPSSLDARVTTLENNQSELGEQVQGIQGEVNVLLNEGYDYESPTSVNAGDFVPQSKGILIGYMSNSGDNSQYTSRIWSSSGAIICQHLSGSYNGKGDTVTLPLKANQTINLSFVDYVFNFYPAA